MNRESTGVMSARRLFAYVLTVLYLELPKDRCVRSCCVINVKKTEILRTPLAAKEPEPLSPNFRPLQHGLQQIIGHTVMTAPLGRLRRAHQGIG